MSIGKIQLLKQTWFSQRFSTFLDVNLLIGKELPILASLCLIFFFQVMVFCRADWASFKETSFVP
jgi:hypothetical protein